MWVNKSIGVFVGNYYMGMMVVVFWVWVVDKGILLFGSFLEILGIGLVGVEGGSFIGICREKSWFVSMVFEDSK